MRSRVEDVMTTEVVTVGERASFKAIVRLLEEYRISAVLVVDRRGAVVGVVSEADLLAKERYPHGHHGLGALEALRQRSALHKAESVIAAELMSSPAVTVPEGTTVAEAARLAASAEVKRLPVVDAAGRPVGVVTRSDLLKVFLRPDEEIRREVADVVQPGVWSSPMVVDVEVAEGVVTLRGQVRQRTFAELLIRMAESVDGVVSVDGDLRWEVDDDAPSLIPLR